MFQHFLENIGIYGTLITILCSIIFVFIALSFRKVVKTNEVHIVQTSKETKSFGKDTDNGNVYYDFPVWIPIFGVFVIVFDNSI